MRHDPASAAVVVMLRGLKMYGMAGAVSGLVTVLRRSPERLELATGDRRDDQAFRRV